MSDQWVQVVEFGISVFMLFGFVGIMLLTAILFSGLGVKK